MSKGKELYKNLDFYFKKNLCFQGNHEEKKDIDNFLTFDLF